MNPNDNSNPLNPLIDPVSSSVISNQILIPYTTTLPAFPAANGYRIVYYDGVSYWLYVYSNGAWRSTGLDSAGFPGSLAQGDVFYYDGTKIARLAAGTSGYVLQTLGASANPTWANISGLSLLGRTILGSDTSVVDVTGFATREFLYVVLYVVPGGGVADTLLRFNGDQTANYDWRTVVNGSYSTATAQTSVDIGGPQTLGALNIFTINNNSGDHKFGRCITNTGNNPGTAPIDQSTMFQWNITSQVSHITALLGGAGNFKTGSYMEVYGSPN